MPTLLRISSALLAAVASIPAAQFTIDNAINGPLDGTVGLGGPVTWSGSNVVAFATTGTGGYVGDGGFDGLDGYGYLRNLGVLTVQRQVDVLVAQSSYRWLDIFTNPTASTVTQTVQFYGDLGSDNNTQTVSTAVGRRVTSDSVAVSDPVLAHVSGSALGGPITAVSSAILNLNTFGNWADDYVLSVTMTLAPGQSTGLLNFLGMARDTSAVRDVAGDLALATTIGTNLFNNPILTGLTAAQIGTISNFATPEPGTLALIAVGLAGLAVMRRRQQQAAVV